MQRLEPAWETPNKSTVLYQGDVREVLASMAEESVQTVVTSPPYW